MGAWQLLHDSGTNINGVDSYDISGLNLTEDDFVMMTATLTNTSGTNTSPLLYVNPDTAGNTTNTNYWAQRILTSGTSVSATRQNQPLFGGIDNGKTTQITCYIKLSENGNFNYFANNAYDTTSGIQLWYYYGTSTFTETSITKLRIATNTAGGKLSTGSRIQIYKLAATKVADITVGSNTTQVDISNLSIDKDSEYLLVGDFYNSGSANNFTLFPNDLTTNSQYYYQFIVGNGTSASAGRGNYSLLGGTPSNSRQISYVHIKLSNIGAFTHQNYNIVNPGTSSVLVNNMFNSSTYENLTSITKLNIGTVGGNISAGTRLQLYKLY